MDDWFYKLFGDEFGPVSYDELVELAKSQTLSIDDEVRFGANGQWRRAGSIGKLMAHLPYQPGKGVTPAAVGAQDLEDFMSGTVTQSSPASHESQWSNGDSFETSGPTSAAKVEEGWWCKVLGNEIGPVPFEELVEMAKANTLSSNDEVRFGENGHWRRAGSIGPLMAHLPFQAAQRVITPTAPQHVVQSRSAEMPVISTPAAAPAPVPTPQPQVVAEEPKAVTESQRLSTRCYCKISDLEYGPIDLAKVMEWAASGRLHGDDYVRIGTNPYVLASELPDIFPKKPAPAAKPVPAPVARVAPVEPAPKPVTDPVISAVADTSPAISSTPERRPYSPPSGGSNSSMSSSSGFGGGSSGFGAGAAAKRPVAPVRKPASSGSSVDIVGMLTGPVGMGVGGVLVLGALIYFALPFLTGGNGADVKRFEALKTAFVALSKARNEDNAKPEQIKEASKNLETVAKKISADLKAIKGNKKPYFTKLKSFSANCQKLAQQDPTKPTTVEADTAKSMQATATALGIK